MLVVSSCSEHRFICRRQRGAPSQLTAVWLCVAESLFGSVGKEKKNRKTDVFLLFLAPPVGLEPTTLRLTAACSTD